MNNSALLIVSAEVVPGKEEEFNKWYDEHHIPLFAGKIPLVKSIRRFYSKRGDPHFITLFEYDSFDELKKSVASEESRVAGEDANKETGNLVKSFTYAVYSQIYPKLT